MEKIGFAYLSKHIKYEQELLTYLKSLNVEVIHINEVDDFTTCLEVGKLIISNQIARAIVIDDYGTLPFMVIGKMKGTIVAQISDEHSAHMTSEHNGANVITIGTEVAGIETIKNIFSKFIKTPFAKGRHLVRTEMLNEMLKQEKGDY